MSSLLLSLPELFESYKTWVSQNPQVVTDCETTAKWLSYFLVGKINNSHILSELIYCISNLLTLFNDRIINNVRKLEMPTSADTLKIWLTVVEYSEVFFELTVKKFWGEAGRWFLIVGVQVFKCIARLFLVYKHKESIIQIPPIPTLNRTTLVKVNNNHSVADIAQAQFDSISFTLSSGKVVRKVEASPPINLRNWKPLQRRRSLGNNEQTIEEALAGRQLVAETIYILKPILHLGLLACFDRSSWKPWISSLGLDLISLQLYGSCKSTKPNSLTPRQKLQLSKRTLMLVMYLLRSPFYEQHSKDRVSALLASLSRNVPLARLICNPLIQYLPFWQANYFYMWSS